MLRCLVLHDELNRLNGTPVHYARTGAHLAMPFIGAKGFAAAAGVHRRENLAKHFWHLDSAPHLTGDPVFENVPWATVLSGACSSRAPIAPTSSERTCIEGLLRDLSSQVSAVSAAIGKLPAEFAARISDRQFDVVVGNKLHRSAKTKISDSHTSAKIHDTANVGTLDLAAGGMLQGNDIADRCGERRQDRPFEQHGRPCR